MDRPSGLHAGDDSLLAVSVSRARTGEAWRATNRSPCASSPSQELCTKHVWPGFDGVGQGTSRGGCGGTMNERTYVMPVRPHAGDAPRPSTRSLRLPIVSISTLSVPAPATRENARAAPSGDQAG